MHRIIFIILSLSLLIGCGKSVARMAQPEDPQGRYKEHISAAKKLLDQKESWSDRAEWEVIKTSSGWEVIAWRVEYPDAKGPKRYLPWGYSLIELDSRLVTVGYKRKG
jgi:major membrane immunogen (membrane-anchored lipoprotein)